MLKKFLIYAGPISGTRVGTISFGKDLDRGWGWWESIKEKTKQWVESGIKHVEKGVSDWWGKVKENKFVNEIVGTAEFGWKVAQAYEKCKNLASMETILKNIYNDAKAVIKPILDQGNVKQQFKSKVVKDALKALYDRNVDHMKELLHCMDDVLPGPPRAISLSLAPAGGIYL